MKIFVLWDRFFSLFYIVFWWKITKQGHFEPLWFKTDFENCHWNFACGLVNTWTFMYKNMWKVYLKFSTCRSTLMLNMYMIFGTMIFIIFKIVKSIVWTICTSISILQMLMNVLHPVQITVMLMQLVQIHLEVSHVLVIADSLEMEQVAQVMSFFNNEWFAIVIHVVLTYLLPIDNCLW